jgi:hypothetical protein
MTSCHPNDFPGITEALLSILHQYLFVANKLRKGACR